MILKTQSRKKPNNPFKRLLKQRIINNDPQVHVSSQVDLYADDYLNLNFH